ncbi:uncharacterized protein MONBRDRAFT_30699 [Monosiga brevicollis MX1]|uniref:Uncharacterized protein n=1 Tax=Monosiga brevicollis TaxID=81824 RepID=A9UNN0_MONBE|nr:uncharacterized protein MONBRDRAFT_30699 [Monosiga brevicollis MX1]EDQ92731.1 predicted protein [Monosiga brevicollis MX1]|eukprot:XP_001742493.1 hypothetical protein [Monosiga brevicollis MX1]
MLKLGILLLVTGCLAADESLPYLVQTGFCIDNDYPDDFYTASGLLYLPPGACQPLLEDYATFTCHSNGSFTVDFYETSACTESQHSELVTDGCLGPYEMTCSEKLPDDVVATVTLSSGGCDETNVFATTLMRTKCSETMSLGMVWEGALVSDGCESSSCETLSKLYLFSKVTAMCIKNKMVQLTAHADNCERVNFNVLAPVDECVSFEALASNTSLQYLNDYYGDDEGVLYVKASCNGATVPGSARGVAWVVAALIASLVSVVL